MITSGYRTNEKPVDKVESEAAWKARKKEERRRRWREFWRGNRMALVAITLGAFALSLASTFVWWRLTHHCAEVKVTWVAKKCHPSWIWSGESVLYLGEVCEEAHFTHSCVRWEKNK